VSVSVLMCACMYICVCIHAFTCVCVVGVRVCLCTCARLHHFCMCVCVSACVCVLKGNLDVSVYTPHVQLDYLVWGYGMCRVAKMRRMPYLYMSFSAKEPCNWWLFCEKRHAI